MGSDDGAKGRDGRSWWSAVAFLFFFVGPMLGLEQYLAAQRRLRVARALAVAPAADARPPAAPAAPPPPPPAARSPLPPPPLSPAARPPPPPRTPAAPPPLPRARAPPADEPEGVADAVAADSLAAPPSLVDELVALAALPPREALAYLDADPLDVERVSNATAWTCPDRRLLSSSPRRNPSRAAAANLKAAKPGAFVWFDHLSKAGGTSFCEFARRNLGIKRTPSYYCMPPDPKVPGPDGRVGRWPGPQLKGYIERTKHAVVANEWDAFPAPVLERDFRDAAVLMTIIRDPLDRLVSTHKFWGILNNPAKVKPELVPWLKRKNAAARARPMRRDTTNDFLSQVGRDNFATWKFASYAEPRFDDCKGDKACARDALATALAVLEKFHVVVPTTWQAWAGPLYAGFGWTRLEEVHVVNIGKVQSSSSKKDLAPSDYAALREANVLDEVLWHWARRAFLERLRCPPEL
ncbi:hypothetical protein AURANDRAFT_60941 [Aureococcus anophagefferens]|uniref:Sulfotransferase domain-containing protein n=1 Tax=Aureococcus anophagefferens TaxID=44056 RepID=F0XWU9_AURAN|nr:hypothetical protein AURANDRAFT_60941 [Aureococcus anophagefferens]EGB12907.1 hypothetical protein AURANDRAFT_60941 [Aureococcus anophagefferens]|eukprot:XP_009032529.1 hypothetical protein AURANDRAFT_60941 [Aureococcus anophagefferens]